MDMDFLEIPVSGWTCANNSGVQWDWVGWVRVISGIGFVSEVDDEESLSYFYFRT